MSRRTWAFAAPAVVLAALAVPTAASASVINLQNPCVAHEPVGGYQPISGTVSGGTPGGRFQIFGVDGKASSFVGTFDGAGNAPFAITSYSVRGIAPSKGQTVALAVNEFTPGGVVVSGTGAVKVTTLAIDLSNKPRAAYSKRVWAISGLAPVTGDRSLWASWYRGKKLVKRIKLGVANECGYLRVKRSAFPNSRYRSLTLRVHSQKKWTKQAPYLKVPVKVVRRYF